MAAAITLQYQGKSTHFEKSDQLVAVRARAGMVEEMHEDLESIAPGVLKMQARSVGSFEVVNLTRSENDIDQDLDWLRSRPSVAAASHVFQQHSNDNVYVPTGNIHLTFTDKVAAHQQQGIFHQFRLQTIEARGSRDFLVSITVGSKNPIATASALQQEPVVHLAEPEFATI